VIIVFTSFCATLLLFYLLLVLLRVGRRRPSPRTHRSRSCSSPAGEQDYLKASCWQEVVLAAEIATIEEWHYRGYKTFLQPWEGNQCFCGYDFSDGRLSASSENRLRQRLHLPSIIVAEKKEAPMTHEALHDLINCEMETYQAVSGDGKVVNTYVTFQRNNDQVLMAAVRKWDRAIAESKKMNR
jgi:hypothetical protein